MVLRSHACLALGVFLASGVSAQTDLISQSGSSAAAASAMSVAPSVTPNGRFVAFSSDGFDFLPPGVDDNHAADIYLVDRLSGDVELVSVDTQGGSADASSVTPRVSRSARYVAFLSDATDLVPNDTNGFMDAFVRDRKLGITIRASVGPAGVQASLPSVELSLSGDGRRVAFMSAASNLVGDGTGGPDTNGHPDVFVHDLSSGVTRRVSIASDGTEGNGASRAPSLSHDGRYVAFESLAYNLVTPDSNGAYDVFVHDLLAGRTVKASVNQFGGEANHSSMAPSLSANGRRVAFFGAANNLVHGDTNSDDDVFVHDLHTRRTVLASADTSGEQGNDSSSTASLSPDGRFVAFDSEAQNLAPVPGGQFVTRRVFLKDLLTGKLIDGGIAVDGGPGNGVAGAPSVSRSGRVLAFQSESTNLVAQPDDNRGWDVFVRLGP